MDFLRRSTNDQPQTARSNGAGQAAPASGAAGETERYKKRGGGDSMPNWLRLAFVILVSSMAILAIALSLLFYFGQDRQARLVDTSKEQAVFLTNGQVYFGKLKALNDQFFDLQNIYYLNSQSSTGSATSTTAPTNLSLVKLGCELHGPQDEMIINSSQVSFWENLTTTGKVAQAIDQWVSQNPTGQKCSTTSSSTQQSTSTPAATTTTH